MYKATSNVDHEISTNPLVPIPYQLMYTNLQLLLRYFRETFNKFL